MDPTSTKMKDAAFARCRQSRVCLVLIAVLAIFTLPADKAQSLNTVVTTCTESSLRAAIANGGYISFNCGSAPITITVTAELEVTIDTVIDGGNVITISGGDVTRVFHTSNYVALTLKNLTISHGKPLSGNGSGGAIYGGWRGKITIVHCRFENNDGTAGLMETGGGAIFVAAGSTLSISSSVFIGNRGAQGGAINNLLSGLTVLNSQFINNDSTAGGSADYGYGGAIYTDGASEYPNDPVGGLIRIEKTTFQGNTAAGQGGAVQAWTYLPDEVYISDSTFDSNQVVLRPDGQAYGGGLRLGRGNMTVVNSTFVNNLAHSQGGALWIGDSNADVTLSNDTLENNAAVSLTGTGGLGGGIMMTSGQLVMNNLTIANNHAGFMGGGIYGGGTNVVLHNTIIATNTASNPWGIKQQCSDVLVDGGNNLQFPRNNPTDLIRPECTTAIQLGDPHLSALANNGGPTWTMALGFNSPALDAGNNSSCSLTDQRGIPRPQGASCDIGAYESVTRLSLNPTIVFAGDPGFTLTVIGDYFGPGNIVQWNGTDLTTSVVDRIFLQAAVPSAEISVPSNISITVTASDLPAATLQVLPLASRVYLPLLSR